MPNTNFWDVGSIHGDEYYTMREDAEVIADHLIQIPLRVWLPFNDTDSAWKYVLEDRGFDVVTTSGDFFTTEPPSGVQCIISNPPFSKKRDVMERIKALDLRFALILPFQWLNDGIPLEYGHQVMFFRQRMIFNTPQGVLNNPRANCFVLSDGLLKSDLTFIDKRKGVREDGKDS
jgi:hypothetical protein